MIFITGGAGFIGSNLAAHFCEQKHDVVVCDWLGSDNVKWRNLAKHPIEALVPPERCFDALERYAAEIEAVIHMGAISATTERDGDAIVRNNFDLSRDLWEWCTRHGKPFIYASSAATYGDGSQGFEDSESLEAHLGLRPLNLYGWSKKWFDVWVLRQIAAGKPTPPRWAGLKFFNVYGPNELHKGAMMSLVSKNHERCAAGQAVQLFKSHHPDYEDGQQLRDFVYVGDCVSVIDWLVEAPRPSRIYNLGSGQARSFLDLISTGFQAANQEVNIEFIDMPEHLRGAYQYYTRADITGLRKSGYDRPMTTVEEGVTQLFSKHLLREDIYR